MHLVSTLLQALEHLPIKVINTNAMVEKMDDICYAKTKDHDKIVQQVVDKAHQFNIKLNREKVQYCKLGIENYVRSFVSNFAELTSPLRQLLKKDTKWIWTDVHS
ncbi:hypothetical protein ILUMI_02270 [Ignelater luminosus]|uniref:Reverse transcriptase domain-containing protein n=1 Tax=Ignelater luminosus TaxID=2038154 RepID=A0A8K0DDR8_IGNLU|nr:hypothetical protein ILUMI_02270 [Ignelater luminosus]